MTPVTGPDLKMAGERMVSNQLGVSTGAADVPAFLWDRHLQRPALRRFQERVRQEPGKARPADRWIATNNPVTPSSATGSAIITHMIVWTGMCGELLDLSVSGCDLLSRWRSGALGGRQ